jgi:ribonuclease HI
MEEKIENKIKAKEQDILERFLVIFKYNIEEKKYSLVDVKFHDYHMIIRLKKTGEFELKSIKIYFKPNSSAFRILPAGSFDIDNKILTAFEITVAFFSQLIFLQSDKDKPDDKLIEKFKNWEKTFIYKDQTGKNNIAKGIVDPKSNDSAGDCENILSKEQETMPDNKYFYVDVYIDGSYDTDLKKASWAFCIVHDKTILFEDYGLVEQQYARLHQVAGELFALLKSLEYIVQNKNENKLNMQHSKIVKNINIYYDYQGLESWINGEWKVKDKDLSIIVEKIKLKIDLLKAFDEKITINFSKVRSHTGNFFNEHVDKLTRKAFC